MNARKKEVLKTIQKIASIFSFTIILVGIIVLVYFLVGLSGESPNDENTKDNNISFCQTGSWLEYKTCVLEIYKIENETIFYNVDGVVRFMDEGSLYDGICDEVTKLQIDEVDLKPYSKLSYGKYSYHTIHLEGNAKTSYIITDGILNMKFTVNNRLRTDTESQYKLSSDLSKQYKLIEDSSGFRINNINKYDENNDVIKFVNTSIRINKLNIFNRFYGISLIVIVVIVLVDLIVHKIIEIIKVNKKKNIKGM